MLSNYIETTNGYTGFFFTGLRKKVHTGIESQNEAENETECVGTVILKKAFLLNPSDTGNPPDLSDIGKIALTDKTDLKGVNGNLLERKRQHFIEAGEWLDQSEITKGIKIAGNGQEPDVYKILAEKQGESSYRTLIIKTIYADAILLANKEFKLSVLIKTLQQGVTFKARLKYESLDICKISHPPDENALEDSELVLLSLKEKWDSGVNATQMKLVLETHASFQHSITYHRVTVAYMPGWRDDLQIVTGSKCDDTQETQGTSETQETQGTSETQGMPEPLSIKSEAVNNSANMTLIKKAIHLKDIIGDKNAPKDTIGNKNGNDNEKVTFKGRMLQLCIELDNFDNSISLSAYYEINNNKTKQNLIDSNLSSGDKRLFYCFSRLPEKEEYDVDTMNLYVETSSESTEHTINYYNIALLSPLQFESDLAPFKARADLVVLGMAGNPTESTGSVFIKAKGSNEYKKLFNRPEIPPFPYNPFDLFGWEPRTSPRRLAGVDSYDAMPTEEEAKDEWENCGNELPPGFSNSFYNSYCRKCVVENESMPASFAPGTFIKIRSNNVEACEFALPDTVVNAIVHHKDPNMPDKKEHWNKRTIRMIMDTLVIDTENDRYVCVWRGCWDFSSIPMDAYRQLLIELKE